MELLNTRMFKWKKNKCSGLAKYMDIILLNKNYIHYNTKLENAKTIFINTRLGEKLIIKFIKIILPKLKNKTNIIIAGADYTFPNNKDVRLTNFRSISKKLIYYLINNKFVNKIFVENLDQDIKKCIPIPLGINPRECPTNLEYFLPFYNSTPKILQFTNFNRVNSGQNQWSERKNVLELCYTNWKNAFADIVPLSTTRNRPKNLRHRIFLNKMSKYAFTVCVHGGGLDVNPKLWEAILIGVIPIIRENKPYTDIYKRISLPVVIVDKWDYNTITLEKLEIWHKKYSKYFKDPKKRQRILNYLSLEYWVNYVSKL
tara:strand:- start:2452 stop:3396 length:945 start_codon:yes stop_codon:yes gene_type:complete